MSSRAFRAAGDDDDDDAIFPNIEGLGVGDTGRPLGSGHRRAQPEDTRRRAAPPMSRERARVAAGGTPGALDDVFVTGGGNIEARGSNDDAAAVYGDGGYGVERDRARLPSGGIFGDDMELREGSSSRSTTEVAGSTGDRVARTVAFDSTNFVRMETRGMRNRGHASAGDALEADSRINRNMGFGGNMGEMGENMGADDNFSGGQSRNIGGDFGEKFGESKKMVDNFGGDLGNCPGVFHLSSGNYYLVRLRPCERLGDFY